MHTTIKAAAVLVTALAIQASLPATAQVPDGTVSIRTAHSFAALVARLEESVARHKLGIVVSASASKAAAGRGITIPGNAVIMVFRNDYAVRMLEASVPAGIEAPLRFYVTEERDGRASLTWRRPSAVFAPYRSAKLDELSRELDPVFEAIAGDAVR